MTAIPIGDSKSSSFTEIDTPGIISAPPSEKLEPGGSSFSLYIPAPAKIDEETDQGDSDACYDTSFFDSWEEPPNTIPDSLEPPPQQLQAIGSLAEPSFAEGEADQSSSEKCLFPALSGVSFTYHQQPPNASSLTPLDPLRPAEHESIARSEVSITSLHSQLPNSIAEFNPLCPLTTLIDGPYSFSSPVPATSSNPPLIKDNLKAIWEVGEVRSRYQALKISQSRDLRERERGSWRIDMASWVSASHKIHFWTSLKEHVTLGRLGWVNVFLDEEGSGNLIKIFCFGGTVEHASCPFSRFARSPRGKGLFLTSRQVWAVLYILSDRRMAGAAWLDAADNEVIKF